VGLRAGLDTKVKGKILCPCRGSNPGRPVRSQTLYCLSYSAPIHKDRHMVSYCATFGLFKIINVLKCLSCKQRSCLVRNAAGYVKSRAEVRDEEAGQKCVGYCTIAVQVLYSILFIVYRAILKCYLDSHSSLDQTTLPITKTA
jgi:hypothetical protein